MRPFCEYCRVSGDYRDVLLTANKLKLDCFVRGCACGVALATRSPFAGCRLRGSHTQCRRLSNNLSTTHTFFVVAEIKVKNVNRRTKSLIFNLRLLRSNAVSNFFLILTYWGLYLLSILKSQRFLVQNRAK